MKSIDYILGVSNIDTMDFSDRLTNINLVLNTFLKNQSNVDINVYIVEQVVNKDNPRFIDHITKPENLKVTHKVVEYPIFCKPWLFNIATKMSSSENIFYADMDSWCNKDYFHDIVEFIDDKKLKWCFGFDKISLMSKEQKEKLISTGEAECDENGNLPPQNQEILAIPFDMHDKNNIRMHDACYEQGYIVPRKKMDEGKLLIFKRDFLVNELIGGNELFRELGANDNEIAYRSHRLSGTYETYPVVMGHLWHPLSTMKFAKSWDLNMRMRKYIQDGDNYLEIIDFLKSVKLGLESGPLDVDVENTKYQLP